MQYVYLVQWPESIGHLAEVFASLNDATRFAKQRSGAWVVMKRVRPVANGYAFVTTDAEQSDPAPATIAEMLASSNI